MRYIEGEEMLSLLQQAVSERGDAWVYPDTGSCRYWFDPDTDDGSEAMLAEFETAQPACAVGLALSYLTEGNVIRWILDNDGNGMNIDSVMYQFNQSNGEVQFTESAIGVAMEMQSLQDDGICWGNALIQSKEWLANWQADNLMGAQ